MSLKTPTFWYRKPEIAAPLLENVLTPLSSLYKLGHRLNQSSKTPKKADIPVLCIGNINAGGSGKTPSAIALMQLIKSKNLFKKPMFLTRGYGGDEAIILNQHAPTIISADRAKGAKEATEMGGDAIIMDDGFQNNTLHKDLQLVVIDGTMGFGNGKLIPAGPLREPIKDGIARADGFIMIGKDTRNIAKDLPQDKPIFQAQIKPHPETNLSKDASYYAFAGLGYPEKFYDFLNQQLGLTLTKTKSFADHHPYDIDEMRDLIKEAESLNAQLITTEKDYWRVPEIAQRQIPYLKVVLEFSDEPALVEFIQSRLPEDQSSKP